jgi:hypothetical protein
VTMVLFFAEVLYYVGFYLSCVVRRAALPKPACSLFISFLYSRSHWMWLAKIRSMILHKHEVREIDRGSMIGHLLVCRILGGGL